MVFEKVKEEESSPALAFTASLDSGGEGIGIDGFLLPIVTVGQEFQSPIDGAYQCNLKDKFSSCENCA